MGNLKDIKPRSIKVQMDKERVLKFDLNAFAELEDVVGSIPELFRKLETGSLKAIRAFLWAGLLHEDKSLTIEHVGSLIDFQGLENISKQLQLALGDSLPEATMGNE